LLDNLYISFYGPTEELYAKWQPPLNWNKTIDNIKRFRKYRDSKNKLKPKMILHVLAIPEIVNAIKGYNKLYVDKAQYVTYDTFHGDVPDYAERECTEKYMKRSAAPRTPCQRLWSSLNVHFDGSVVPCCIDYNDENVLGNAATHSLEEIWLGNKFQQFRQLHIQGKWNEIPMCRECRVHEYNFSSDWVSYWRNRQFT
jgi:radical SAM protein with 4Fe4S-binding SPASM domain